MKKLTVFTPTYNRAYIIERLYESLKKQTIKDFEWVIVYDGSTDNTKEVVSKIACGEKAGEYLYGNSKFRIINNGIDLEKYQNVSKEQCKIVKEELGILENELVIGNVARFEKVKNHNFLLILPRN